MYEQNKGGKDEGLLGSGALGVSSECVFPEMIAVSTSNLEI